MAEHKIQSSGQGELHLTLQKVPKALGALKSRWCPRAMIVSFKLETDEALLIAKAGKAIEEYGVHMVVANELHSRKEVVFLVTPATTDVATDTDTDTTINNHNAVDAPTLFTAPPQIQHQQPTTHVEKVVRPADDAVIENVLVQRVVAAHHRHIATSHYTHPRCTLYKDEK